jgi:stress response protein YsnF
VILREEEPVVEKRVQPRERVRLDKDTVTGEERVAEEVRKEQIEVQGEDGKLGRQERRRRR